MTIEVIDGYSVDVEAPLLSPDVEMPVTLSLDVQVVPVQGLPGVPGASLEGGYTHTQSAPAAEWNINHGLGKYPTVLLFTDSDGDQPVETDVHYIDVNNIIAIWPSPESGRAELD